MKTCNQCKETKPLSDFNKHRRAKDGRQSACRLCESVYQAMWRKAPGNKERKAQYVQDNRHIWWELGYKRRAEQSGFPVVIESFTKEQLVKRHGDACVDCGGEWKEIDHVIPVSRGGVHTLDNCVPICGPCNHTRWFAVLHEEQGM